MSYNAFMPSALVIVALVGVAAWSLPAISPFVDVNRGIATQSLPALGMGTSLREQLGGPTRTEMDARPAPGEPAQRAWNDRAARMAKDFVSHELRTPLTAAKEATHLLFERVQGPFTAKHGQRVDIIAASSDRLLRLVNQVLELARLCRGRGGSGLELAIVKGRVEAHGGRIRVESEEGRGSCFLVRLPRDSAPPPVGAAPMGSER